MPVGSTPSSLPRTSVSPTGDGFPDPAVELTVRLRAAGCVFAEREAELLCAAARDAAEREELTLRRLGGVPLEHVLGWAEFDGRRYAVGPGVFVPRRRSEFLVRCGARRARPGALVVDLCCGTGALGASLHHALGGVELHAADLDAAAVECARRNLEPLGARVHHGDLLAALPSPLRGRIEVLVANVPYVPSAAGRFLPPEAREHEPRLAWDGGGDGLEVLRRLLAEAVEWLAPGGLLLVEAGESQAGVARDLMAAAGLDAQVHEDVREGEVLATVVLGSRPDS